MKRILIFSILLLLFLVLSIFPVGAGFGTSHANTVIKTIQFSNDPGGIAVTPDGNYVYVAINYEGIVRVIRTSDNTVVDTIDIGGDSRYDVAITPNGEFVYVTDFDGQIIRVIQTLDNKVVDTVPPDDSPYIFPSSLAITPNGHTVYVTNSCNPCNAVSVIQTSNNTMVDYIIVGPSDDVVGACPQGIAVTPDGHYVYVANAFDYTIPGGTDDGTVSVIRTSDNIVVKTILVGGNPVDVAITPDGEYVYVSVDDTTVSVIRTSDNTLVDTITDGVGPRPSRMAVTPNGAYVFVVNHHSNTVSVIQTSDNTVVDTITVGYGPWCIAITPNGNTAYVGKEDDNTVSVIGIGPPGADYEIGYSFVQHLVHEDGSDYNRLNFAIYDETNRPVAEDLVAQVDLMDPNGQPVNLSNLEFSNTRISFPYYDSENGKWVYNFDGNGELFFAWSGYFAIIEDSLIEGEYNLTVTDNQGNQYTSQFTFNGQVDLPIIEKKKFKKKYADGNLILKWSVPYDLDSTWSTSVRAHINIYKEGEYTGVLFTKIPTHLGRLFVPSEVIEKLLAEGDKFFLQIQLRTNDNNNRTYSKEKKIKLKLKE